MNFMGLVEGLVRMLFFLSVIACQPCTTTARTNSLHNPVQPSTTICTPLPPLMVIYQQPTFLRTVCGPLQACFVSAAC